MRWDGSTGTSTVDRPVLIRTVDESELEVDVEVGLRNAFFVMSFVEVENEVCTLSAYCRGLQVPL
jgi:hypothetical protein